MTEASSPPRPPEALFYHLERTALEAALPSLLERCLERGWRAVVRGTIEERLEMLDDHLWAYRDDSFLPHGRAQAGSAARQPILLTTELGAPNQAQVLFLIDGASLDGAEGFQRDCVLFDGGDAGSLAHARGQWKATKAQGLSATYWKQTEAGGWAKAG